MADSISGKFDYNSLVRTLKQNGVQTNDMTAALRQVAHDNDISNIRNLDKSEKITINKSIFAGSQTQDVQAVNPLNSNFFMTNQDEALTLAPIIMGGNGEDKPAEVFNEEDYEIVDYDDFYNFGDSPVKAQTMEWRADRDGHTEYKFQTMEWRSDRDSYDEGEVVLLNANAPYTTNPMMLNQPGFSADIPQDKNYATDVNKDREDLLEGAMQMEMNMSNDAFNA